MSWFSMVPWATDTSGDGAARYTEEQSNKFFRYFDVQDWAAEGVVKGSELGEFDIVDDTLGSVTISGGAAICYGRVWGEADWNVEETDPIPSPAIGTTGGRIVLRADWSTRQIRPAWKMSADGNAAIPALQQDAGDVWEISLYTFTLTTGGVITITDDRTYRRVTGVVGTDEIEDAAVETAKLADDSVDDIKAGDRVPQFYRRQGGSATDWSDAGATNYTPGAVRMQAGVISATITDGNANSGIVSVTFPVAFSAKPNIFVNAASSGGSISGLPNVFADRYLPTATGFNIILRSMDGTLSSGNTTRQVSWLAIGPE